VKKPVDLGFLNLSTLERRRHFCAEEVRLNGRGAPGMYLGVVPITRASGTGKRVVLVGGGGAAIEYALKMRQFPGDALLSSALQCGEVNEADVLQLAMTVAEYHARSPVVDGGQFGSPETVRRDIWMRSTNVTGPSVGDLLEEQWFAETRHFSDGFFDRRSALLWSRIELGYVRECHGDLHLANICRWEGKTLLFDCIEFNEAFRRIDVLCDAAFVTMDFDGHGRPDLANAFVNAYAEETGDWAGLSVLPLYLCRNAYVRGMVNSIVFSDPLATPAETSAARGRAARYFELAWRYAQPRARVLCDFRWCVGRSSHAAVGSFCPRVSSSHATGSPGSIQRRSPSRRSKIAEVSRCIPYASGLGA
jgi:aminoglycoside phosphotransferase family enzyme